MYTPSTYISDSISQLITPLFALTFFLLLLLLFTTLFAVKMMMILRIDAVLMFKGFGNFSFK